MVPSCLQARTAERIHAITDPREASARPNAVHLTQMNGRIALLPARENSWTFAEGLPRTVWTAQIPLQRLARFSGM